MKRFVAVVLVCLMLGNAAWAEGIDLSAMDYDELVALKEQINLAIWNCEEWQEVEVPQGVWVIGEDIPAGKWTIKAFDGTPAYIYCGDKLDETGVEIARNANIRVSDIVCSESYRNYDVGDTVQVTWDMKEGQYFVVQDGIAVFAPYAGKADLGFKSGN